MSKIVFSITEDILQAAIQSRSGRILTKRELEKVAAELLQNEDLYDGVYKRLIMIAREITKVERG
jgi:hypothetical protein